MSALFQSEHDFEIGKRLDEAIVELLGEGSSKKFEDIGRKSAQQHLTGIHASFVEQGDPESFLKKAEMIYEYYYDTGYREYEATGETSGILTTYDAET